MSVVSPNQTPPSGPPPDKPYPWRIGLGVAVVVLVVAGLLYALMELTRGPATSDQYPAPATATALAERVAATAAAVPTEAPTVQPTALPATQAPATAAPTGQPVVQPTTRLAATPMPPTAAAEPSTATPIATAAAPATVDPALDKEVSDAYLHYFQVRSEALLYLDPTVLDAVAADGALEGLQKDIDQQRADGRALRTNVVHSFDVVRLPGDEPDAVSVIDHYKDLSVWVDPTTLDPLPGQAVPASPDVAPQVNVVYHLHRIDGVWKVVGGERYVP